MFDWAIEHENYIISKIIFRISNLIGNIRFYVFSRGVCWLVGCDDHRGHGWNMPMDCTEWWCDRCGAEGINHQVWTRDLLYGVIPTFRDWVNGLPWRIRQKLCKHKFVPHHEMYQRTEGMIVGHCKKCHKYMWKE